MLVSALYPVTLGHFITYDFSLILVKQMQRDWEIGFSFLLFHHSTPLLQWAFAPVIPPANGYVQVYLLHFFCRDTYKKWGMRHGYSWINFLNVKGYVSLFDLVRN